jgi:hypothetical protein
MVIPLRTVITSSNPQMVLVTEEQQKIRDISWPQELEVQPWWQAPTTWVLCTKHTSPSVMVNIHRCQSLAPLYTVPSLEEKWQESCLTNTYFVQAWAK